MYSLIQVDQSLVGKFPRPMVYLGGQCRGRDWRNEFFHRYERSDVTFINPKRDFFVDPEQDPMGHAKQVGWEREALEACDMGVFWLGEGLSNQAARVEIGYLLGLRKPVLLGADPGFMGVEHLTGFSGLVVASSLEGLISRFGSLLSSFQS